MFGVQNGRLHINHQSKHSLKGGKTRSGQRAWNTNSWVKGGDHQEQLWYLVLLPDIEFHIDIKSDGDEQAFFKMINSKQRVPWVWLRPCSETETRKTDAATKLNYNIDTGPGRFTLFSSKSRFSHLSRDSYKTRIILSWALTSFRRMWITPEWHKCRLSTLLEGLFFHVSEPMSLIPLLLFSTMVQTASPLNTGGSNNDLMW